MGIQIMETYFMLLCKRNYQRFVILFCSLCANYSIAEAVITEICPMRHGSPLQFVDVFDGPPERLTYLMADQSKKESGFWNLSYIYEANRYVTVRCKYEDKQILDVKINHKITRCDYLLKSKKQPKVICQ